MTTTDKRHEETALAIVDRLMREQSSVSSVSGRVVQQIASALASAEAELVARMMEPSKAVIESICSRDPPDLVRDDWRTMLRVMALPAHKQRHTDRVAAVARAIGDELEHSYDKLPWCSQCYQYDQKTLRRIARAAIRAIEEWKP
jgi:HD-GYP domain-containing protein (c-di-GMP phosphodiesterase class II)